MFIARLATLAAAALAITSIAEAKTLRWASQGDALTLDPHAQNEGPTSAMNAHVYEPLISRDPSLAKVPALALAARAVRDQMSNGTWMVLATVERALALPSEPPDSLTEADPLLAAAQGQTLAGMLTLSGVAGESSTIRIGGGRSTRTSVCSLVSTAERRPTASPWSTDSWAATIQSLALFWSRARRSIDALQTTRATSALTSIRGRI